MSILDRVIDRFFGGEIQKRISLAVRALDDVTDRQYGTASTKRDRYGADRRTVLDDTLAAWRENPLARRIVELTSDYVVGGGIGVSSPHAGTNKFLAEFWNDRLNRLQVRCFDLCDELTRSGDLFIAISTDASGMSYVRAIPASEIENVATRGNDVEQETEYQQRNPIDQTQPIVWRAFDPQNDMLDDAGKFVPVMIHYAINRPVGAIFGESDLAPLVKWLARYSAFLEDRVRLNRFRQAFIWIVSKVWRNDAERVTRQNELNANPPNPGSVLVKDDAETWDVAHPKLDSFEADTDASSLKKLIAAGAGVPTHFLGEPEGSTRTTAESSGGATFRHYARRQLFFLWMVKDICSIARSRRAQVDSKVKDSAEIITRGTDISTKDNTQLSMAATQIVNAFKQLFDLGLITEEELLRLSYTFAGEVVDIETILKDAKIQRKPTDQTAQPPKAASVPAQPAQPAGASTSPNPAIGSGK